MDPASKLTSVHEGSLQKLTTDNERLALAAQADSMTADHLVDRQPRIRHSVRIAACRDLIEVLTLALNHEVNYRFCSRHRFTTQANRRERPGRKSTELISKIMNEGNKTKPFSTSGKKNERCWNCGTEWHMRTSCRRKTKKPLETDSQRKVEWSAWRGREHVQCESARGWED